MSTVGVKGLEVTHGSVEFMLISINV